MGWMTGKWSLWDKITAVPIISGIIVYGICMSIGNKFKKKPVLVCGKKCDHGSECLLPPKHQGGHDTQHGCIFYDD